MNLKTALDLDVLFNALCIFEREKEKKTWS